MEQAQGVFEDKIIVANSAATTGIFATTGDPLNAGIRAYFDMVNAGGGIDGRRLVFLHEDDAYEPSRARAALHRFMQERKVFAYVGHFGAPAVQATLADIHASGMPVVYFATGIGELYKEKAETAMDGACCFPIQPIYITEGRVMVARAVGNFGARSIGVIQTMDDTGKDLGAGVKMACEKLDLPCEIFQIRADAWDADRAAEGIKARQPDFVIVAAAQAAAPEIIRTLAAHHVRIPVFTTYLNMVLTLAQQILPVTEGMFPVYASGWLNYEEERGKNLEAASEWLGDYAMNTYAHCGWIGAHFLCEGLRRLKGHAVTWESFREAMEERPIMNPFGGMIDYARSRRLGTQEMSMWKLDGKALIGWKEVDGLRSIGEILRGIA